MFNIKKIKNKKTKVDGEKKRNTNNKKKVKNEEEKTEKSFNQSETEEISEKKFNLEENVEAMAQKAGLPFIDLKKETVPREILNIIPEPIATTHSVVAFDEDDKKVKVALLDPNDLQTLDFLKKKIDKKLEVYVTTPESMQALTKQYHKGLEAEFEEITSKAAEKTQGKDGKDLKELAQDLPIIRMVDTLLEYAIFEGASDIHIEPEEKFAAVRYRVDGVLRKVMSLPKNTLPGIVARIKILSNLKLDEHRLPQDGRFKIETPKYKISFRVSIIPVFDGEKIVMRLLNESNSVLTLEQLGFQDRSLKIVQENIVKPHGMILVTGPTGSGKTTTLYTIMNMLNKPGVNITTIEDPIEYRMPGINQSQVNPKIGYKFSSGLRSFLRQDPDIIMVGEIRDSETADIAVNAAMTGHLVLSTLHTNDAATALPRLDDMKVEPFLIASTVNIIIAQRLVRKICKECKEKYSIDKEMEKQLEDAFDIPALLDALEKHGTLKGGKKSLSSIEFSRGKGCKQCGNSGYKGRVGIYEVLEVSGGVADLILKKASAEEINKKAMEEGMITMLQDGFMKVKAGMTTVEEILRVTQE